MRIAYLLIYALVAINSTLAEDKKLANFKSFRNYYTFELQSSTKHQIQVWYKYLDQFNFEQWGFSNIAIGKKEDVEKLTPEKFIKTGEIIVGWPKPPSSYKSLPASLVPLETLIREKFINILPEKKITKHPFLFAYKGKNLRLNIEESVPLMYREMKHNSFWYGKSSSKNFSINLEQKTVVSIGGLGYSTAGLLFSDIDDVKTTNWMNFQPSEEISGSLLFTLDYSSVKEIATQKHLDERKRLDKKILEIAEKLQNNIKFDSSLETVLTSQSESTLPTNFLQHLEFNFTLFKMPKDQNGDKTFKRFKAIFPLNKNQINQSFVDANTPGVVIKLEGNLFGTNAELKLSLQDDKGNKAVKKIIIEKKPSIDYFIKDLEQGSIGAIGLSIRSENDDETSIPGNNEFAVFKLDGIFQTIDVLPLERPKK